jgi:hypothetical protein
MARLELSFRVTDRVCRLLESTTGRRNVTFELYIKLSGFPAFCTPHIQTEELVLVKQGTYVFPPRLGDSGEVCEPVVGVVQLNAPRACSCRVGHVIRTCLTADGRIQYETLVHIWIDVDVVLVGHGDPLGLDHVLLATFVAFVGDETVTLGGKRDEYDSVEEGFEFVAPAADSGPSSAHFSG